MTLDFILIEEKMALYLASAMYAIYCGALARIGFKSHQRKAENRADKEVYPPGYFAWVAIQTVPLWFTGLALSDPYVEYTRGFTLLFVVAAFLAIKNGDGIFRWKYYRWIVYPMLVLLIVGGVVWGEDARVRAIVQAYPTQLGWISIGLMGLFFWFGQRRTAKAVWQSFRDGQYNIGGFWIQWVRLTGFLLQGYYYTKVFGFWNPIALQGWMGAIGALLIIGSYVRGIFRGKPKQSPDNVQAEAQAPVAQAAA